MAPSHSAAAAIPCHQHLASTQIHQASLASPSPSSKVASSTRVLSSPIASQQFTTSSHHQSASLRFSPTISSSTDSVANHNNSQTSTNPRSRSSSRFQSQQPDCSATVRPIWRSSVSSSGYIGSSNINASARTLKAAPITTIRQQSIRLLQRKSDIPIPATVAAREAQTCSNPISPLRVNHNNNKPLSSTRLSSSSSAAAVAAARSSSSSSNSTRKQLITSSSKTSSSSSSSSLISSSASRPILSATNSRLRQGALYARRHQHYPPSSSLLSTSVGGSCNQLVQASSLTLATGAVHHPAKVFHKRNNLIGINQTGNNEISSSSSGRNKSKSLGSKFNLTSSTSSLSVAVVKRARSQTAHPPYCLNNVSATAVAAEPIAAAKSGNSSMLTASSHLNNLPNCGEHSITSASIQLRTQSNLNQQQTSYQIPTDPSDCLTSSQLDARYSTSGRRSTSVVVPHTNTSSTGHLALHNNNNNNNNNNTNICGGASSAASSFCDNANSNAPGENQKPSDAILVKSISMSSSESPQLITNANTSNIILGNQCVDTTTTNKIINHQRLQPLTNNYTGINSNNNNPLQERKLSDVTNHQMILTSPSVSELHLTISPVATPPDSLITTSIPDIPIRTDQITDHYELETRPFARGKFAQVKRCIDKSSRQCFAAKCIKKRSRLTDIRRDILLEIEALKLSYYSGHIVKLYEVYETTNEMILVLEMANGGELQRIIDDEEVIPERLVKRMVRQILEGLIQLHDNNIAHLDIKPQNVLLTQTYPDGDIKLCDFGISRRITKECEIREICGTPDYVAPEILRYDPISLATDMWSLGVLTYVLLSGYSPFGSENKQQTFCNITQAPLEFPSEIFDKISKEAIDFMKKIIVREPSERLTSRQAINHIWLR